MSSSRVLWLLNHTTLRKFELAQLKSMGIKEVFLPKSFPFDEGNLSASIDYSEDYNLTIPPEDLDILNAQDWYVSPSDEAWAIANKYFDVAIIGFFPSQIDAAIRRFQGAVIMRVFGLSKGYSYSKLMYEEHGESIVRGIKKIGPRFWFGAGYEHLKDCEQPFLQARNCFLPVGLQGDARPDQWEGKEKKILFVCPRIGTSPYFERVYKEFINDFKGLNYSIGGAQPINVPDTNVLGFVSAEEHVYNMTQHRVMFYHSTEPNHIHYHPFEAVRVGMPLLFMAGGMLDSMGGKELPGRCISISDARKKAERLLSGDRKLIKAIRSSQIILLEPMRPEVCAPIWQINFNHVLNELALYKSEHSHRLRKRIRIAVIVPVEYRGGSLRGAKLLSEALAIGSKAAGESAEVYLGHLDNPNVYTEDEFSDIHPDVKLRPYTWKHLDRDTARRAMRYSGHEGWEPKADVYVAPDDGINQFQDCDIWIVISDRLALPLLPARPVLLMVYDYLQRYVPILQHGADLPFLSAARNATRVLVTTEFTKSDAVQYAGVKESLVRKLPLLAPDFSQVANNSIAERGYFIWTTNLASHKNHLNAFKALQFYYEELDGKLDCRITGVNTNKLLEKSNGHLEEVRKIFGQSPILKKRVKIKGELADRSYQMCLASANFLWHAAKIDNGTFSVIEAAGVGIPSLSSDYPAMREIDSQFSLNLSWMNADQPKQMAAQLKQMELTYPQQAARLPTPEMLATQRVGCHAEEYWKVIKECL